MKRCVALFLAAGVSAALSAAFLNGEDVPANTPPKGFTRRSTASRWRAGPVPLADVRKRAKMTAAEQEEAAEGVRREGHAALEGRGRRAVYDGQGANLATVKDYTDFELMADWKIEAGGDSGVYLRGVPQVQIWDSATLTDKLAEDKDKGSGGLWNNPKGSAGKDPAKNADLPPGQWNSFRIVMKGDKVSVTLNGQLVVDKAPLTAITPLPEKGPIELQQHPKQDGKLGKIQFRNVYIRELTE